MKVSLRFYSGIITSKLHESKEFYTKNFGFKVAFENEWFILLHLGEFQFGFMQPDHPTQRPIFQTEFGGKGVWFATKLMTLTGNTSASRRSTFQSPLNYVMSPGETGISPWQTPTESVLTL